MWRERFGLHRLGMCGLVRVRLRIRRRILHGALAACFVDRQPGRYRRAMPGERRALLTALNTTGVTHIPWMRIGWGVVIGVALGFIAELLGGKYARGAAIPPH